MRLAAKPLAHFNNYEGPDDRLGAACPAQAI